MRINIVCYAAAMLMLSTSSAAQRRPATAPQEDKVSIAVDLRVNGAPYAFKGQAACHHLAKGSIYDTLAERWSVQQNAGGNNMSLTLWRPVKGTGDMVTLSITSGGKRYDVSTVKAPQATRNTGTGTVRFTRQGAGGIFAVEAATVSGAKITGTITCEKFTVPEVVAGN
jgi:hypothetical protein